MLRRAFWCCRRCNVFSGGLSRFYLQNSLFPCVINLGGFKSGAAKLLLFQYQVLAKTMKVSLSHIVKVSVTALLAYGLAACSQPPAAVEIHHSIAYNRPDYSPARDVNLLSPYKINVRKGDTLYSIARNNEVQIRDLIELNRLEAPYQLVVGQQVKLPKPTYHAVKKGDSLYDIARGYKISMNALIEENHLQKPYTLRSGQRLKIPGMQVDTQSTETAIDQNETRPKLAYSRDVNSKSLSSETRNRREVADARGPVPVARGSQRTRSSRSDMVSHMSHGGKPSFIWPVDGRVVSSFGPKKGGLQNDGINIAAAEGAPIHASDDGVVVYAGNELRGYGNLVLIKHNDGYLSAYAHAEKMLVRKGQHVARGQKIATVGHTGHVKTPQLHFSIRKGRKAVDPSHYLAKSYSSR